MLIDDYVAGNKLMHLNKVEHHSLWVLKLKGGASPNIPGDTNTGAFVQVLPALDPQSLGPCETPSSPGCVITCRAAVGV